MDLVKRFTEYLLADKGYSTATAEDYERDLRSLEHFFHSLEGGLSWTTIDADVIRQWMAQKMEGGMDARTVKRRLAAFRSFYRFLQRVGLTERNPAALVVNPKTKKRLPTFLKEQEMDRLFDKVHFGEGFTAVRDRLVLLIFYTTGIRVSELAGLPASAVDVVVGELKVTGKRNKQRIIPFGEELAEELKAYLPLRAECVGGGETKSLIVDEKGTGLTDAQLREIVRKYLSMVTTQKKRTPHVLRHTFATVMLNNGADIGAVKELLGHESLSTTEVYTHTSFGDLKKAYAAAHPREKEE